MEKEKTTDPQVNFISFNRATIQRQAPDSALSVVKIKYLPTL
jgi:hypothetical protein